VTALVADAAAVLCLGALAMFMTRTSAGTISVSHRRPWLRGVDAAEVEHY
jgi:hypothetical protein